MDRLDTADPDGRGAVVDGLIERLEGVDVARRVGSLRRRQAGARRLMKTLALELGQHGITANRVAPGEVATPTTGQQDGDPQAKSRPGVPLGRPGDAREIAAVIAFLASPQASYVTGASWPVDGGMLPMGRLAGSHIPSGDWRTV